MRRRGEERTSFGLVFDGLAMLSAVLWIVGLASRGVIGVETAALLLLGFTACVALARAAGMSVVGFALRVGMPLASLATFVAWNSNGTTEDMIEVLASVLALLMVAFGLYLAMRGALGGRRRR